MENSPKDLKYAFLGRKEIHPCVPQDIGPLGPLPKKREEERQRATKTLNLEKNLSYEKKIERQTI